VRVCRKKKERHIACHDVQKFDPAPARTKKKYPLETVHDGHTKLILKLFMSPLYGLNRHSHMSGRKLNGQHDIRARTVKMIAPRM